jgi:hypothetical protein
MAFTATDVGPRIDLLIDGQGYIFDDTLDSGSVYSQHQRAELGLSPSLSSARTSRETTATTSRTSG